MRERGHLSLAGSRYTAGPPDRVSCPPPSRYQRRAPSCPSIPDPKQRGPAGYRAAVPPSTRAIPSTLSTFFSSLECNLPGLGPDVPGPIRQRDARRSNALAHRTAITNHACYQPRSCRGEGERLPVVRKQSRRLRPSSFEGVMSGSPYHPSPQLYSGNVEGVS